MSTQESLAQQMANFVIRIATSESRLWTLTIEAKVTRKQAEDIYKQMQAEHGSGTHP